MTIEYDERNVLLSGPFSLTEYDCLVFNAIVGLFQGNEKEIIVTPEEIYRAALGENPSLEDLEKTIKSIRKLGMMHFVYNPDLKDLLSPRLIDTSLCLLYPTLRIVGNALGFAIPRPKIKRLTTEMMTLQWI